MKKSSVLDDSKHRQGSLYSSLITLTLFLTESRGQGDPAPPFVVVPAINMRQSVCEKPKEAAGLLDIYHSLFPVNKQIL